MSSRRAVLPLVLLVAVSLLVAACGDDGGDEDAESTTTTEADETTTTEDEADDTTTTETPADETSEPAGGETAEGSMPSIEDIEGIDDFCTIWTTGESASDLGDISATTPEETQQAAQLLNALLVQGVATAPPEIKDDFSAMADSVLDFYGILADYEYDFTALSQAAASDPELGARMEAVYTADLEAQTQNVEAWVAANC
jgi:hypothetical protein